MVSEAEAGPDIVLNISFCVPVKNESHTGLKQHHGEEIMTELSFFLTIYSFKKMQLKF